MTMIRVMNVDGCIFDGLALLKGCIYVRIKEYGGIGGVVSDYPVGNKA